MKFVFKLSRVIMGVRKKIDIPFDIPLPIVLEDSFTIFTPLYKDRWQPTAGDDSLHCEKEKDNEYDKR